LSPNSCRIASRLSCALATPSTALPTLIIADDQHTKLKEGTIEAHIVEKLIDISIILFCIAAAPMEILALNALPVMGV
jgi:hypothetical protein